MADRDRQSMGNQRSLAGGAYSVNVRLPGQATSITQGDSSDWFGPLNPLAPIAPPDVKGRILDYPSGYNLNIRPRAYSTITFDMLRAFADRYDLLRLLIETRKDQMSRLQWNIVPRDKKLNQRGATVPEALQSRIQKVYDFFLMPDQENFWGDWLRLLLEDLFVIDAPTIYRRKTYGGELYALQPLDGGTIKRVIDNWGNTPEPPAPAYQQVLKGYPAVDYTSEELIYRPRVRRTNQIYGYSPVEQIVMTINIGMRRQAWQLESFTEGNIPEALIGTPDTWTPDQVRQFQDWFDSMLQGNTGERRRARFVPGDVAKSYVPTKPSELFGQAEEWLIRVMCFAFNISPQPFVQMMNRATSETAQETAALDGLAPIQNWVKGLMDYLLIKDFKSPDLEFKWLEEDELDPDKKSQIIDREQAAGRLTFNEARKEQGLDPVDHPNADRPMFKAADGWKPIFLTPEEEAEAKAMQEQIAGGKPGGDGDDSGDTPPGDGEVSSDSASDGDGDEDPGEGEEDLDKAARSQPRHPKGSSKGGQFASTRGNVLGIDDARAMGVSDVWAGKLTDEEVRNLRAKIDDKNSTQEEVLEAMAPIYANTPASGKETLVLDKETGAAPDGFWDGRKYRVGGNSEEGDTTDLDGALKSLEAKAVSYAGEGGVKYEKEAYLFLGPSAAGKSTHAEAFAKKRGAAIVDSDDAKKVIPGYLGGIGANAVHEESSQMSRMVESRMLSQGANIIVPTVGANPKGIGDRIDRLQAAGYKVTLVDVKVGKDEATRRMAGRALNTGRPIGADYVRSVGDKPSQTYDQLKGKANGWARIEAGTPKGQEYVAESNSRWFTAAGKPVFGKSAGSGAEVRGPLGGPERPDEGTSSEGPGLGKGQVTKAEVGEHSHFPFAPCCPDHGETVCKADAPELPPYPDPLRPEAAKAEAKLGKKIARVLGRLKRSIVAQLSAVKKADDPEEELQGILDSLDLAVLAMAQDELEEFLEEIAADSARIVLSQMGLEQVSDNIVDRVNERALKWARARAAELVSFDDDMDPLLAQTTREMLRSTIADGIERNIGMPEIAKLIEDNYAFSEERAMVIASTEITSANSEGALQSYREAEEEGVKVKKSWLRLGDACSICVSNAEAGPIPLDEAFPSGDMAPGAHPYCRCVLVPEVEDMDGDGDIDEEDVEKSDQPRHPAGSSKGGQFASSKAGLMALPTVPADQRHFGGSLGEEVEVEQLGMTRSKFIVGASSKSTVAVEVDPKSIGISQKTVGRDKVARMVDDVDSLPDVRVVLFNHKDGSREIIQTEGTHRIAANVVAGKSKMRVLAEVQYDDGKYRGKKPTAKDLADFGLKAAPKS